MATKGTVSGVIANMVTLVVDGPVAQNEICYISTGGDRLMAEVIKGVGTHGYVQVFESTRGLKVGAEAEFTGHMLEVTLGPGMLSKNYDGLQNDLDKMDGVFLKRGQYTYPLDKGSRWHFMPLVKVGDKVEAAAWLGQVDENFQPLKIMVPFTQKGVCTVKSIVDEGEYSIEDIVAVLTDEEGNDIHAFLLLLAHRLILIRTDLVAVLVLDQHVPIDHWKGFFTFQYMGFQVMRLLEGEVHRQLVALSSRLQLEEERVGTRVVAASHVLRETCKSGCTANPAFFPVGSLHLLHTGNHHFGKAVDGYLSGIAGCVSSIRHSFRHPLPDGPSG